MARIIIREQDLTGNRIDQDFTDIAFIPGFVKYPNKDYQNPQMCWSEGQFIDMFGNEPAIANSKFVYNVNYNGTPFSNPKNGEANFVLDTNEVEAVSDSAYHYARELLYRGLPIYYCPMNDVYTEEENPDLAGQMKPFNGVANGDSKDPEVKLPDGKEIVEAYTLEESTSGDMGVVSEIIYKEAGTANGVQLTFEHDPFEGEGEVTYQWYKLGLDDNYEPDKTYRKLLLDGAKTSVYTALRQRYHKWESGAQYYCVATQTITDTSTEPATVTTNTKYSKTVKIMCVGGSEEGNKTASASVSLKILEKNDSTTSYMINSQAGSEKIELKVKTEKEESGQLVNKPEDPTYFISSGPQPQIVPYNYNIVCTCQVEGINIESFSYKWTIQEVDPNTGEADDDSVEQIISTQQICKFASTTFGPGSYIIKVYVNAVPMNAYILGTIEVNSPAGKEMKASQVLAAAKADAITKASRVSNEYFTGKLLDWFTTNENIELLKDRGMYNFKYLTSGGYPIFEAAQINSDGTSTEFGKWQLCLQNMLSICGQKTVDDSKDYIADDGSTQRQGRGDCIFLIDHQLDRAQDTMDLYEQVRMWFEDPANVNAETLEFAAMYTPWCKYNMTYTSHNVSVNMPASYAYLTCLADSIQAYDNWHAISGVTRGTVKNIQEILLDKPLTNTKANKCQTDPEEAEPGRLSINCITEIKPYGNVIWGNRTLQKADPYKHVTAMGFVNLRNEVSDIKKLVYRAARRWMFEQNTSVLWINFKSTITPLLERMVNGYGLSRYEIRRGEKTKKHKLYAEIRIWPIYAVEYIDVTIQILDEETIVTEE